MFTLASLPLTAHIQPTHGRTSTRMADELLTRARAMLALMRDDRDAPLREQGSGGQPAAQSTISARESVDAITARHRRDSTPQSANRQPVPPHLRSPRSSALDGASDEHRRSGLAPAAPPRASPAAGRFRGADCKRQGHRSYRAEARAYICDCTSAPAATCKRRPRAERGPTSPRRSPPERPHARSSPPKSPWGSVTLVPCAEQRPAASRAASGAPMLVPRAEPAASGRPWRTLARAVH